MVESLRARRWWRPPPPLPPPSSPSIAIHFTTPGPLLLPLPSFNTSLPYASPPAMGNLTSCCIKFSLLRSLWRSQIQLAHDPPLFLASKRLDLLPQGLACLALSDQSASVSKESDLSFPDLPEEIMDRIRACLPLSAYVRSALVSKLWWHSTFSPRLLDLCSEMRPSEPWLFALSIEPTDLCSYALDSEFCRWRKVGVSGMPRDRGYPVAAAGGLLCINTYDAENQVLLVLNPLMATSKELPRRNVNRADPVVGIAIDAQSSSFKVIAVGSFEAEAVTEVYDSTTDQWTITARLPVQRKLAFSCSLFSGGFFYCWTAGPPEAVLVYDMQQGTWTEIPMLVPSSYAYGKLVEHNGKILLVGVTHGADAFKSIRIWELQEPGMEMHEIARMPYGILKDFCGKGKGPLVDQIVSSGNLLYLYSKRNPKLVVCNLTKKPPQWQQLAPLNPVGIDKGKLYLFSFCVHAKVISSIWNFER